MHIDWWTLALQAINVLILIWILGRFFYRPLADIIEKRRVTAAKLLTEASSAQAAVDAEKAGITATRAGFIAERDNLLAEARKRAEAERDATLRKAAESASRLRADNEVLLARNREAMEHAMVERASTLAVEIAQKLLHELPPGLATTALLNALSQSFTALPPESRELLAAAATSGGLHVTSAAPLDAPQQAHWQKLIETMLGTKAKLTFGSDPDLIAGVEISSDTVILKKNWRDDLSRIRQQLGNDDG